MTDRPVAPTNDPIDEDSLGGRWKVQNRLQGVDGILRLIHSDSISTTKTQWLANPDLNKTHDIQLARCKTPVVLAAVLNLNDLDSIRTMHFANLKDLEEAVVSHNHNIRKKVFIEPNTLQNLIYFSRAVFPPGETAETHNHSDMAEIFYVSSGCAQVTVNGQDFICKEGSCITIEPHENHQLTNTSDQDLILLYLGIQA